MLTNNGKTYIKRYLAAQVPAIAQCIAFGIGSKAESAADTALQFEVGRADIVLTSYDFVANKVIFKAVLPDDFSGVINEVALFSQMDNPMAGSAGSKVLASFDSDTETWTDNAGNLAPYTTTNARLGGDSLNLAPGSGATSQYVLNDVLFDLSNNSGADNFVFAYNVGANVSSIEVRFRTDASNYYSYTIASPSAGYKITTHAKGSAVVTGTPSWANITSIEVRTTATGAGAASVGFDGIRVEDTDTVNPEYVMVSREQLATPFIKTEGKTQEIEYALGVSI